MATYSPYLMKNGQKAMLIKDPRPDSSNCTVRALSELLDIPYEEADEALTALGRERNKPFPFIKVAQEYGLKEMDLGIRFNRNTGRPNGTMGVGTFCKRFPKGTFLVRTLRHVFVVKDGVPFDSGTMNPNKDVWNVWHS